MGDPDLDLELEKAQRSLSDVADRLAGSVLAVDQPCAGMASARSDPTLGLAGGPLFAQPPLHYFPSSVKVLASMTNRYLTSLRTTRSQASSTSGAVMTSTSGGWSAL